MNNGRPFILKMNIPNFYQKIKIGIFLAMMMFMVCPSIMAQDDAVRIRYNEAIDSIVQEIIRAKNGYPELEGFTRSVISQDSNGYSVMYYMHDSSSEAINNQDPYAYQLSISAKSIGELETVPVDGALWVTRFPLLGIKVVVESQKRGEWTSFDLKRIVETNMEGLKSLEQEALPFRLELKAQKEDYEVYEDITIIASLKNKGVKAFQLADLDENSLYCKIGQSEWGSPEASPVMNQILNTYSSIDKILRVYGVDTPQELWISCTYAIAFKGVQPYNRIKVTIKPRS